MKICLLSSLVSWVACIFLCFTVNGTEPNEILTTPAFRDVVCWPQSSSVKSWRIKCPRYYLDRNFFWILTYLGPTAPLAIMFTLQVWVGFEASWRSGILCKSYSFVNSLALGDHKYVRKDTYSHVGKDTFWVLCSEGHFLSIVRKDTFQNMINKTV